ncbi:MAG: fibrobacter succinogenes major paralogous domain-containing protein [Bacteroidales bacterium]|nr:fibrobacter succinogenes major paralogous domain-containing protein [Bacteroidales bacterium]
MKKLFITVIAVVSATFLFAQSPSLMSYQAVVRNADNQLVTNTEIGLKISILQGSPTGTEVYSEIQNPTTNANGLLSIEFGGETGFDAIDWTYGTFFIKTEIDLDGGTNYTISGTNQMLSVPFALHSNTTENYDETDPVFAASPAVGVQSQDITNWNSAYSWGNHADYGYLVSFNEMQDLANVIANGSDANNRITNLENPVSDQDAATKFYIDSIIADLKLNIYAELGVTDIEGNHYETVRIGDQIWMAENLKTTKFNNGDDITVVSIWSDWINTTSPAMCWFYDNPATYKETYGGLYNFYAVNPGNLCPDGWHVPSETEWQTLIDYVGGVNIAGGELKEKGYTFWANPNTGANNTYGFNARGCGNRNHTTGDFDFDQEQANFWTSTNVTGQIAKDVEMYYNSANAEINNGSMKQGTSVRCVKD